MSVRILMLARALATGTLTYTDSLISSLQELDVEVAVACFGQNVPKLPCKTIALGSGPLRSLDEYFFTQSFRSLTDAHRLGRVIRQFRPNIIFAQGVDELAATGILASRLFGLPVVTFVHDLTERELSLARHGWTAKILTTLSLMRQSLTARRLVAILVSSEFMRKSLKASLGVEPFVTPLGVSGEYFGVPNARQRHPFRIIFVGNLTVKKMPEVAIGALALLPDLDLRLTVVGDGALKEEMQRLVEREELQRKVEFVGRLSRPELLRELGSAHACVVPSMWEGFGLAALEAMAAGVPVVASSSGGLKEIVKDGQTGLLFAPGNPTELAKKIRQLHDNRDRWSKMVTQSRIMAREYTWEKTASTTLQIIRRVLSEQ